MADLAKALSLNSTSTSVGGTPVLTSVAVSQGSRVLQDAYISVNFKKSGIRFDIGQQKLPFSLEGIQTSGTLDVVERALFISDKPRGGGLADTREVGITVTVPVSKYADVQFGAFNGAGEAQNDVSKFDQKATAGRLVLNVLEQCTASEELHIGAACKAQRPRHVLRIGTSGIFSNGTSTILRPRHDRFGVEALYIFQRLTLKGEFVSAKDQVVAREGWYAHVGYRFSPRFEPIFRIDQFDPDVQKNTGIADAAERDYVAGLNYYITPAPNENRLKLQFNYLRKTFDEAILPSRNFAVVNLQTNW